MTKVDIMKTVRNRSHKARGIMVEPVGANEIVTCTSCGGRWQPMIKSGGGRHRNWWRCPHYNCNQNVKG